VQIAKGDGDEIDYAEFKATGRVILASSSASKTALQAKDGLSLYTGFLLEGMEGAVATDRSPWITARDLHHHAEQRFEIAKGGSYPPKIIAADTSFDLPIAKAPKPDAESEYRKQVGKVLQKLDQKLGLAFKGTIDNPLARGALETLRQKLKLSPEEAQKIEQEVQSPYLARAEQRGAYTDYFKAAVSNGCLPDEDDRHWLTDIRQNLGLSSEDAAWIEQALAQALNLHPDALVSPSVTAISTDNAPTISPVPSIGQKASPPPASTNRASAIKAAAQRLGLGEKRPASLTTASSFVETLAKDVDLAMIAIPAGEFWMGANDNEEGASKDEYPRHKVNVPAFYMGRYPVTQAQWAAIAQLPKINIDLEPNPAHFKGLDRPVESITWFEAIEFCDRLSRKTGKAYRLPSEAEWEYACRAGTKTPFHFGDTLSTEIANYDGNYTYGQGVKGEYRQQTTPVGKFPANAFGLHDMHGNVWEWCADHWHGSYDRAPQDGSVWETGGNSDYRLLRGGSWNSSPAYCRSAIRYFNDPARRVNYIGFRVVLVFS
jgi:formylglycine-generating enzyme required for sulfatase activity